MSSPGNPNDRPFFDDSSFPDGSPYAGGNPFPPTQSFAPAAPVAGRGGASTGLIVAIVAVVVALLAVGGIAVAMLMNRGDSANGSGGGPVAPIGQPTTVTAEEAAPETVTVTEEARETTETTTVRETTRDRSSSSDDLGTGRNDVDSRGWNTPGARCHPGDKAFAVIQVQSGARASACQTPGGRQYYRGHDPDVGSLETEIIGSSERDIVAQNGSVKYQMSFAGLLISDGGETIANSPANVWGRVYPD